MVITRTLVVGGACALLYNALMIVGDWLGMHYTSSLSVSFVVLLILGYRLHSGWTYKNVERSAASFGRYALVAIVNYPLSLAGMFVLVDLLGLSVPVASPILTLFMFGANFAGTRWALRAGGA